VDCGWARGERRRGRLAWTLMIGRQHEKRVLREILDGVSRRGAGVLVRGEPGIGKTVLVSEVEEAARERGFEVWRTVAVESETSLPFAGLHLLLRPVMDRVADLPGPQRDALLAAFGMAAVSTPDPWRAGSRATPSSCSPRCATGSTARWRPPE
jgi:hypothetical protein